MPGSFNEQVVVITGASSGIGAAIARCFAEEGAQLHLVGRNASALKLLAGETRRKTREVETYQADISTEEGTARLVSNLQSDCRRVDVLVHSAGIITTAPFDTALPEDFDRQYRTNVRAPYVITQGLLPMLRSSHGSVVFINSSAGLTTRPNISQYSATKHALKAVADGLRSEVNADDVRVLSIYPGRTASPQQVAIHQSEGKPYRPELLMQPCDVARVLIDALKVNRTAEVTDIHIRPMRKS